MFKLKEYLKSKIDRIIYKNFSPFLGRILDKLFFTSFSRTGINFYHHYNKNDYKIDDPNKICFIHLPKTGGITVWETLKNNNFPLYSFPKNSLHNPVSLYCSAKKFRYVTVMRNPIDRVYSQFFMYKKLKENISNHGLILTLKTQLAFKNLACQYYSGLIDENVDERIFNIAKENLNKFFFIMNFDNFEEDLKKLFNKLNINSKITIEHKNKSVYKKISQEEKEAIEIYNYWDLKLYEHFEKNIRAE